MVLFIFGLCIGLIIGAIINSSKEESRKEKYKAEFQKQIDHEKHMVEINNLIDGIDSNTIKNLVNVDTKFADNEIKFISEDFLTQGEIANFAERKINSIYFRPKKDCDSSHEFFGKKAVITGVFKSFQDRNDLAKLLHDVGVDLDTSITEKIDFVVIGENAGWRKLELIESFCIKKYNEEEIKKIFKI